MNGLILLADGFEDTEALTTRDVLIRAGINVVLASITHTTTVTSSFGLNVQSNTNIFDINEEDFDFLVLPGGGRGTQNLKASSSVKALILKFKNKEKLICAICAAPSILGELGLLKETKFTCFAGFNKNVDGLFTASEVEYSNNIITGRSMKYSIDFALKIVEVLLGNETKEKVLTGLKGLQEK